MVRAAAMGTVALVGMGSNGRERGSRRLGVAVLGLLLVVPDLAISAGFALSVLATGGILFLAPAWRDALMTWLPRWVAEAVSVPLAAQVACTPVVTALSGQISLVAVLANLLAAPAIAPATVLGLAGGLVGLVWTPLGQVVAAPAAWSVGWIVVVAQRGAALPTASITGGPGRWRWWSSPPCAGSRSWWLPGCCATAARASAARRCWSSRSSPDRPLPGGPPTTGCWPCATSGRATVWCSTPAPERAWWSTPDRTPC